MHIGVRLQLARLEIGLRRARQVLTWALFDREQTQESAVSRLQGLQLTHTSSVVIPDTQPATVHPKIHTLLFEDACGSWDAD